MKLPKQVPAVERKVNKEAALPAGANVCPSFGWGDIWDVVKTVGPPLIGALA